MHCKFDVPDGTGSAEASPSRKMISKCVLDESPDANTHFSSRHFVPIAISRSEGYFVNGCKPVRCVEPNANFTASAEDSRLDIRPIRAPDELTATQRAIFFIRGGSFEGNVLVALPSSCVETIRVKVKVAARHVRQGKRNHRFWGTTTAILNGHR